MKLEELFNYVNDSLHLEIVSQNQDILAVYNGKDSIPCSLNDCEVIYFNPDWNNRLLRVEIKDTIRIRIICEMLHDICAMAEHGDCAEVIIEEVMNAEDSIIIQYMNIYDIN